MSYPTCKTCKAYEAPRAYWISDYSGHCTHPKLNSVVVDIDGLCANDIEEQMDVGPDFGCIHHEAK